MSTLVVLAGLPATGKTTVAREVASRLQWPYLRLDTIEHRITTAGIVPGTVGYSVLYALAADQLAVGVPVVVDSVSPVAASRDAWREVASETGAEIVLIEVACSDVDEHRRRVRTRDVGIPGLAVPTWADIQDRDYEPWTSPHHVLDTAGQSVEESVEQVLRWIDVNPVREFSKGTR
ncbi:adenylyl-sulfate kinase [Rhodococcus sp. 15-649-1-2]|nr:AAA family ATPase [Rhodococcus sp. 15-649-1-2]OZE82224.1 adenylyl-sulfate kinase [Rhodococcus sp. 15-649-1-2]